MTKTNAKHNCSGCGACSESTAEQKVNTSVEQKESLGYGFYSNVLNKPFERLEDLKKAEYVYYEEQKAKEEKVSQKKADAKKVEEAFKALNAARKTYKEDLTQLTKEYSESLAKLNEAFNLGKKDIHSRLAEKEDAYSAALKEFTDNHPEGYHLTLRDSDFETTISGQRNTSSTNFNATNLFDLFFGF